jgi:hypothetical protein
VDQLRQTYVIDDCIPENFQQQIIDETIYQNWKLSGHNKKYFPAGQKNDPYPAYAFGLTIKKENEILNKDVYEKVSLPIVEYIKKSVNIKEKDIILNRAFLQLPLEDKFIKPNHGIHLDNDIEHYVAVYYMFDSDGDTVIFEQSKYEIHCKSEEKKLFGNAKLLNQANPSTLRLPNGKKLTEHARVTPKKGRVVLFDGARWHCANQPRNNLRCILNFNLV